MSMLFVMIVLLNGQVGVQVYEVRTEACQRAAQDIAERLGAKADVASISVACVPEGNAA